jgi:plasmid stabilization system protein ParE
MRKLITKDTASEELRKIRIFLDEQFANQKVFDDLLNGIEEHGLLLCEFPLTGNFLKGKKFKKKKYANLRWVIEAPYYIFYTFSDTEISIERIIHTSRNYERLL